MKSLSDDHLAPELAVLLKTRIVMVNPEDQTGLPAAGLVHRFDQSGDVSRPAPRGDEDG
jgi:hypothetical protein